MKVNYYEFYNELKKKKSYQEEIHCPMMLKTIMESVRLTAFCKAANISESTVREWLRIHPLLNECYRVALVYAREEWEEEAENAFEDFDDKEWISRGNRLFKLKEQAKINLNVDFTANPYEQYQNIVRQTCGGELSSNDIKACVELINSGTRVYEMFKLQQEIDTMKEDLTTMSQRNGTNNIVPISQTANAN